LDHRLTREISSVSDRQPGSSDPLLTDAIRVVAMGGDPDVALGELLRAAAGAADAPRAAALLWDASAGGLRVAGSLGLGDDDLAAYTAAAADRSSAIAGAANDRQPVLGTTDPAYPDGVLGAWPVVLGGGGVEEPIGALAVSRPAPWAIDPIDGERIAAIADLVGILVDRARLTADAQERGDWLER